jgi:hypothetical protein
MDGFLTVRLGKEMLGNNMHSVMCEPVHSYKLSTWSRALRKLKVLRLVGSLVSHALTTLDFFISPSRIFVSMTHPRSICSIRPEVCVIHVRNRRAVLLAEE